jgi:Uma2 family endonuclease
MALPMLEKRFDAAAYLAWEETQAERHEYLVGEVFAMVGVRQSHNIATGNLPWLPAPELKGTPCRVFVEAVKTRVEAADCFFYPDVVVTCDARDRLTPDYVSHPLLVAEVLSESTAAFDRGRKFAAYRKLESLQDYVLVDLAAQRIEVFRRDPRTIGCSTTTLAATTSNSPRWACACRLMNCSKTLKKTLRRWPRQRRFCHERHPQADSAVKRDEVADGQVRHPVGGAACNGRNAAGATRFSRRHSSAHRCRPGGGDRRSQEGQPVARRPALGLPSGRHRRQL